jgi:hypothetical protein
MLPEHQELAPLVSSAIESLLGIHLPTWTHSHVEHPWRDAGEAWHTMAVPIDGARPLLVAAGVAPGCGRVLAAAMFGLPPEEIDDDMVRDGLGEVVNVLAGQLKGAYRPDQVIGLPRRLERDHLPPDPADAVHAAILLGDEVRVWVMVRA